MLKSELKALNCDSVKECSKESKKYIDLEVEVAEIQKRLDNYLE